MTVGPERALSNPQRKSLQRDRWAVLAIAGGDNYCLMFGGAAGGSVTNFPSGNPFKLFAVRNATGEPGCPP